MIKLSDIAIAALGVAAIAVVASTPVPAFADTPGSFGGSTRLNGISLNGISLNGGGSNGISLQGFAHNGIDSQCADAAGKACKPVRRLSPGPILQGVALNGINWNGPLLQGIALNGITFNSARLNDLRWNGVGLNSKLFNDIKWNGRAFNGRKEAIAPKIVVRGVTLANGQRLVIK